MKVAVYLPALFKRIIGISAEADAKTLIWELLRIFAIQDPATANRIVDRDQYDPDYRQTRTALSKFGKTISINKED